MNYKQAMESKDAEGWKEEVENEHNRMLKHEVRKPVELNDVPKGAKVIDSTWAMKKRATEP